MTGAVESPLFEPAEPRSVTVLLAGKCSRCARISFPRRDSCPACGADATAVELAGPARARILTAVMAQPPGALIQAPYEVTVAEFDEGSCVIGLVCGSIEVGDLVCPVVMQPYDGGRTFGFRRVEQPSREETTA